MKFIIVGLIFVVLFVGFIFILGTGLDAQSRATMAQANLEYTRGQVEANLIRAQSQANLASAQTSQQNAIAFGMIMITLVPWGVLFVTSLLGLGVLALIFSLTYFRHKDNQIPQIIYLPNPSLPRFETWRQLEAMKNVEIIPVSYERVEK